MSSDEIHRIRQAVEEARSAFLENSHPRQSHTRMAPEMQARTLEAYRRWRVLGDAVGSPELLSEIDED